jgi:hypothetical protein
VTGPDGGGATTVRAHAEPARRADLIGERLPDDLSLLFNAAADRVRLAPPRYGRDEPYDGGYEDVDRDVVQLVDGTLTWRDGLAGPQDGRLPSARRCRDLQVRSDQRLVGSRPPRHPAERVADRAGLLDRLREQLVADGAPGAASGRRRAHHRPLLAAMPWSAACRRSPIRFA